MEISEIKTFMKANKITYKDLSEKSGVPESTLKNIFAGFTQNPRIDTMQAIEKALGLDKSPADISDPVKIALYESDGISEEGLKDINDFIEFVKAREKKK